MKDSIKENAAFFCYDIKSWGYYIQEWIEFLRQELNIEFLDSWWVDVDDVIRFNTSKKLENYKLYYLYETEDMFYFSDESFPLVGLLYHGRKKVGALYIKKDWKYKDKFITLLNYSTFLSLQHDYKNFRSISDLSWKEAKNKFIFLNWIDLKKLSSKQIKDLSGDEIKNFLNEWAISESKITNEKYGLTSIVKNLFDKKNEPEIFIPWFLKKKLFFKDFKMLKKFNIIKSKNWRTWNISLYFAYNYRFKK